METELEEKREEGISGFHFLKDDYRPISPEIHPKPTTVVSRTISSYDSDKFKELIFTEKI